jgi:hypothetical protein
MPTSKRAGHPLPFPPIETILSEAPRAHLANVQTYPYSHPQQEQQLQESPSGSGTSQVTQLTLPNFDQQQGHFYADGQRFDGSAMLAQYGHPISSSDLDLHQASTHWVRACKKITI